MPDAWLRPAQSRWQPLAVMVALLVLVLLAGWVRVATIWPERVGLDEAPYDDEGVYAAAAQFVGDGHQPYRDFFYAHPPLGPFLFAPATRYHYTPWGSPTTFMLLRYLAVVFSSATVGLIFLTGWRLWGLGGGILSGMLVALDPQVVTWTGRHIMLESPLLCLMTLAVLLSILGRQQARWSTAFLVLAGFSAAAAGGIKLQGLIILLALLADLAWQQRSGLLPLLSGVALCWLPLTIYLFWLRASDPLGQFVWMQLLRPADGLRQLTQRTSQIIEATPLILAPGLLGLLALIIAASLRRSGQRLCFSLPPGWTALLAWLLVTVLMLGFSRAYYAHYSVHLTLPLALLAGALPPLLARSWRATGAVRRVAVALTTGVLLVTVSLGARSWPELLAQRPDRLYTIVGRYAGDAARPDEAVFALDAQFPFRAARRPAVDGQQRFLVDSYGLLLYHGLGIAQLSLRERFAQLLAPPGSDPYAVMWRTTPQDELRQAMSGATLVVLDTRSDGRLTDETRRWLNAHGTAVERQERYVIYRINR